MAKVLNPHVNLLNRNGYLSLGWQDADGFRYHVWLDPNTLEPELGAMGQPKLKTKPVVYKRVPEEQEQGLRHSQIVRYLDGTAAVNAKMIAEARAAVDIPGAVAAHLAQLRAAELENAEKHRIAYIRDCKKEAGEALYDALKGLMQAALSMGMRDSNTYFVAAKEAIKAADADALTLSAEEFI